jgi:hypothetical protein
MVFVNSPPLQPAPPAQMHPAVYLAPPPPPAAYSLAAPAPYPHPGQQRSHSYAAAHGRSQRYREG